MHKKTWSDLISHPNLEPNMSEGHQQQDPVAVLETISHQGPVDVLNQLKFRETAKYPDEMALPACSGKEAFRRYSESLPPVLAKIGGSVKIWHGRVLAELAPGHGESWDVMLVFQFQSVDALIRLFNDPDFHSVHVHRAAAIEHSRTFVCRSE